MFKIIIEYEYRGGTITSEATNTLDEVIQQIKDFPLANLEGILKKVTLIPKEV